MFTIDILRRGDLALILNLLNQGYDVDHIQDMQQSPLHYAIEIAENPQMVRLLLKHGADINIPDFFNYIPLEYAIQQQNEEIVRILLESGADVNYGNIDGDTLLLKAIRSDKGTNIVDVLLKFGAEVNKAGKYSVTPLYLATDKKNISVIHTLLKYGANVNCVCHDQTPLHLILKSTGNFEDIILLLLEFGADINMKMHIQNSITNLKQIIPLDYAEKLNEMSIVHILLTHIVKLTALKVYISSENLNKFKILVNNNVEDEVNKLKKHLINNNYNLSVCDILTKSIWQVSRFANNQDLRKQLELYKFDTNFPIYTVTLMYRRKKALFVRDLYCEVYKIMEYILNGFGLPEICIWHILKFFSYEDLKFLKLQQRNYY